MFFKRILYIFITGVLFLSINTPIAQGQSYLKIQASPARQEIVIKPGETANFKVNFTNLGIEPILGTIKAIDFITDKNQKPILIYKKEEIPEDYSASSWITISPTQATIPAKETISIQGKITAPENTQPGGRYSAIVLELNTSNNPSGADNASGALISPKIASLLLITIDGEVKESAQITSLKVPVFMEHGPIPIDFSIKNNSSIHISPEPSILITDILGNIVTREKIEKQNIFPKTARDYSSTLGKKYMLGRYKINVGIIYGTSNNSAQQNAYVIIFPYKEILLILLLASLMLFFAKKIRMKLFKQINKQ